MAVMSHLNAKYLSVTGTQRCRTFRAWLFFLLFLQVLGLCATLWVMTPSRAWLQSIWRKALLLNAQREIFVDVPGPLRKFRYLALTCCKHWLGYTKSQLDDLREVFYEEESGATCRLSIEIILVQCRMYLRNIDKLFRLFLTCRPSSPFKGLS